MEGTDSLGPSTDPDFQSLSRHLEQRLEEIVTTLTPESFTALYQKDRVIRDAARLVARGIEADSLCFWIMNPDRSELVVSHSEPDDQMMGRELPIGEGMISLVLASEQALCENAVYESERHSSRFDNELGIITCAMIAVPFYLDGHLIGILSCIRQKSEPTDPDPPGFSAAHLNAMQHLARTTERQIKYLMLLRLTGLEE